VGPWLVGIDEVKRDLQAGKDVALGRLYGDRHLPARCAAIETEADGRQKRAVSVRSGKKYKKCCGDWRPEAPLIARATLPVQF
jgi:hypothetical protein